MAFIPIPSIAAASKRNKELGMGGSTGAQSICPLGVFLMIVITLLGVIVTGVTKQPWGALVGTLAGIYVLFALRVADQWEKAVVLRMGRFQGLRGPGMFYVIPIVDSVSRVVDQRVRVTDVTAESALTKDTVPVNVDAIVYWVVWDAEKCVLEVENFFEAITLGAQSALREAIGAHELHDIITGRETMGKELQRILDEKTNPWGITVQSVEIKQVNIPQALEDAMSRKAQAERERQARIILGTAETEIAQKFADASVLYQNNPVAFNLRAMNMLYEAIKEKGSMVIVPSSAVESMGLGGTMGIASSAGRMLAPPIAAPAAAPEGK
jgi:regulator of protease activity HflC (stomatin/prohibitin superfamily)